MYTTTIGSTARPDDSWYPMPHNLPWNCENTTHHEVGHAIVTEALGCLVGDILIEPGEDGTWSGQCSYMIVPPPQGRIMMAIAGHLAVDTELSPSELFDCLPESDFRKCVECLQQITHSTRTLRVLFGLLTRETARILRRYESAVEALVEALQEQHELDGDEVRSIIEQATSGYC